ncbi:substrate-binding periplasmic protein [Pseudomonas sp.]|uniref:substrate-binding periplasmic protein n=1 Tax=Pseudomonas sp. TaxID=306 RepID=UPI003D0D56FA
MRRFVAACVAWVGAMGCAPVLAQQEVRVGGVYFPPYVYKGEQAITRGLLPQLVAALNEAQSDFRFVIVPTSIPRRFRDFEDGRIDLALFENPSWDLWATTPHQAIDMGLEDAEVFVARVEAERGQDYFDRLEGKRLALFNGYHYAFAGFKADPEHLIKSHNAALTYSHDSNLLMVMRRRADVALVTRSYISGFVERYGQYSGQLLVSERVDQVYRHHALLRQGAPISAGQFEALQERLRADGTLERIFAPKQILVRPAAAADSSAATDAAD